MNSSSIMGSFNQPALKPVCKVCMLARQGFLSADTLKDFSNLSSLYNTWCHEIGVPTRPDLRAKYAAPCRNEVTG